MSGRWVAVSLPGGTPRQDWVPDEQPASPDGRAGTWHVVVDPGGGPSSWEWHPAAPPAPPPTPAQAPLAERYAPAGANPIPLSPAFAIRRPPRALASNVAPIGLFVGGCLLAGSTLLSWIHVVLFGDLSLLDLARIGRRLGHDYRMEAYVGFTYGLAGAAVLAGLVRPRSTVRIARILGAVSSGWAGYMVYDLQRGVAKTSGFVSVGIGGWVALAGAIGMLVSGIVAADTNP